MMNRDDLHRAYMEQRRKAQSAARSFPYLMYLAVMDGSTRPSHAALHGCIWQKNDPVWNLIYPPTAPGCRCRTCALTEGQIKREGLTVLPSPRLLGTRSSGGLIEHGIQWVDPSTSVLQTVWLEMVDA